MYCCIELSRWLYCQDTFLDGLGYAKNCCDFPVPCAPARPGRFVAGLDAPAAPAARVMTSIPAGMTSRPMPSPAMTAILCVISLHSRRREAAINGGEKTVRYLTRTLA